MTTQFEGGYFLFSEPLVRGFNFNSHTAKDMGSLSDYTVQSVNAIQDTPWQTNDFILKTVLGLVEGGVNCAVDDDVVLRVERPERPAPSFLPKDVWAGLAREDKLKEKAKQARLYEEFEENLGTYRATKRIIESAVEMSQFDKFYFPHNMDFRLRIYPIPTDLTPQSNDLSKGLLRFARPTRLGTEGFFWLGFSVASHWGEDKLSPKERFMFAQEPWFNIEMCKWVDDPLTNREWMSADSPYQFLAAAYEWVWANRLVRPEDFMSYLPGNLDGSCNGAQHLSIMARDLTGATATNCRSNSITKGKRFDLYMEVADKVWERLQEDSANGNETASGWLAKMSDPVKRRKVVKRSVMTVPYGVTEYGVADFMIKDKHVDKKEDGYWDRAKYMRDLIMEAIEGMLSNGRALQRWFQTCATICAEAGKPLQWDTPAGSKVTQAYRNLISKRIVTLNTRFIVYEEPEETEEGEEFLSRVGMDVKKMGTSAPPNVVHSCDAAHLQITVCRMRDAGIKDFSMIHDSFGCPMAQVGLMRDILRQSIVDMYAGDYLQEWKASVERYSGLTMPKPPKKGDFRIEEILESEYFFS